MMRSILSLACRFAVLVAALTFFACGSPQDDASGQQAQQMPAPTPAPTPQIPSVYEGKTLVQWFDYFISNYETDPAAPEKLKTLTKSLDWLQGADAQETQTMRLLFSGGGMTAQQYQTSTKEKVLGILSLSTAALGQIHAKQGKPSLGLIYEAVNSGVPHVVIRALPFLEFHVPEQSQVVAPILQRILKESPRGNPRWVALGRDDYPPGDHIYAVCLDLAEKCEEAGVPVLLTELHETLKPREYAGYSGDILGRLKRLKGKAAGGLPHLIQMLNGLLAMKTVSPLQMTSHNQLKWDLQQCISEILANSRMTGPLLDGMLAQSNITLKYQAIMAAEMGTTLSMRSIGTLNEMKGGIVQEADRLGKMMASAKSAPQPEQFNYIALEPGSDEDQQNMSNPQVTQSVRGVIVTGLPNSKTKKVAVYVYGKLNPGETQTEIQRLNEMQGAGGASIQKMEEQQKYLLALGAKIDALVSGVESQATPVSPSLPF